MKNLLTFAFLFCATLLCAQDFEGIMTWKITSEITDPKVKAQMDAAQKKMNDPASQAQVKELQAKMDDPQFKQMMESNPQMKAQIEAAIKMAQGGDLSAMMPKGYTAKFKDKNMISTMEGGMMSNMEFLYLSKEDQSYVVNRSAKTYSVMPKSTETTDKKDLDVKITKTTETTKILNYTCTKYIADVKSENGTTMQQIFWATKDLPGIDFKNMAKQRMGNSQRMWYAEIDGVPLKVEMKVPQGTMVMEATGIKKQSLPSSDFVIPDGYKETKMGF